MTEDKICLSDLFPLQRSLDEEIGEKHGVTYASTAHRRLLALLVELGEFANETRCFKYWSDKGMGPKGRIIDEYADALHFFLSIGVSLGVSSYTHRFSVREKDLSEALLSVYSLSCKLLDDLTPENYLSAFSSFLNIIPLLDYSAEDVREAYLAKLSVNRQRQKEGY